MINIQKMMQQAQQAQFKLQEMQEKLKEVEVSGESGGGLARVVMTCDGRLQSLSVDPSVLSDKETLEDLIVAAVNNASDAKESRIQAETESLMKGMGLPAGAKLPF